MIVCFEQDNKTFMFRKRWSNQFIDVLSDYQLLKLDFRELVTPKITVVSTVSTTYFNIWNIWIFSSVVLMFIIWIWE
jgi:hypothetical protein